MSFIEKLLKVFMPWKSSKWATWKSQNSINTCMPCKTLHNKIFLSSEVGHSVIWPMHMFCHCRIEAIEVIPAGMATEDGTNGADYWLAHKGKLPEKYLTKEEAEMLGWKRKRGNLDEVANGKAIGGNIYYNDNGNLPQKDGRTWYEADINYTSGFRGNERILYSNDGLIFVTYDHYKTFYVISE